MTSLRRHGALAALVLAAAVGACGGRTAGQPTSPPDESDCASQQRAAAPPFSPAPRWEPEKAELALSVRVPRARLLEALDERVPEVLARGGRRVSVGRLSYSVKRGPFELSLQRNALVVEVPIRVAASVCVPFGGLCPSVGGCSPSLATVVEVPLALNDRYELGPSRVATHVHRGCSIAGHDATGQIRQNAKSQSARLKQQIDELLPSVRPELTALWQGLQQPIPLEEGACLVARPTELVQYPAELDEEHLRFRLAVVTTLEQQRPCRAGLTEGARRPLPPPTSRAGSERRAVLAVARQLPWSEAAQQLRERLAGAAPPAATPGRIREVHATGVRAPQSARAPAAPLVALRLALDAAGCDPPWLLAEPKAANTRDAIDLTGVRPVAGAAPTAPSELTAWLEQHSRLALSPLSRGLPEKLRALVSDAANERGPKVTAEAFAPAPTSPSVVVGQRALWRMDRSRGQLVLTVR